jgi:pSer/pThr/pTyr-binding forkhead associated (FHA) protein
MPSNSPVNDTYTVCTVCNYANLPDALICAKCFTLLFAAGGDRTNQMETDEYPIPDLNAIRELRRNMPQTTVNPEMITFYVAGFIAPLVLHVTDQVILGRQNKNSKPTQMLHPLVDLAPYSAQERGVSRMHALLQHKAGVFLVQDLSSSNGTRINGELLPPHLPLALNSGDRLSLSRLQMLVAFGG